MPRYSRHKLQLDTIKSDFIRSLN